MKNKTIFKICSVGIIFLLCFYAICILCNTLLTEMENSSFDVNYDDIRYMKNYRKCESDFKELNSEIEEACEKIAEEVKDDYNSVRFFQKDSEWLVYVYNDEACIAEGSISIGSIKNIEAIEKNFKEKLVAVTYKKANREFVFHLGEYCRIAILDGDIEIR